MNKYLGLLSIWFLITSCQTEKIRKSDIRSAQKLFGVEFTTEQIQTMRNYLERNRRGYDSMHAKPLPYGVLPAVHFHPLPQDFQVVDNGLNKVEGWEEVVEMPEIIEELAFYSVSQLAYLIRTRKVTSMQLTEMFINRIKKHDAELKAVITLTEERALEKAKKADSEISAGNYRGPLHGIPYGVKDLASVKGYPTTWGATPYQDQEIEEDAEIIRRLDEAGAILIAKLVSGALARGDVWFGGQTKNPWDTKKGAGGSSAGSGSAMSAGLVAFSIGTETLGSITSPSTNCGVTGLRPTYGRVSRTGVMPLSWTMDKVGPICRTAIDCALVFRAIQGRDSFDPMTIQADFSLDFTEDIENLKIGYFKELFDADTTQSGINAKAVVQWLKESGFTLDELQLPETLDYPSFDIILRSEAGASFEQLVRTGEDATMVQQDASSRANSLRQSRFIPAVEYLQAMRHRTQLIEDFNEVIKEYDVVLTPTFGGKQLMITNLTGHPVITVPSGFDQDGLPTSVSFLGNLFDEASILLLASHYQEKVNLSLVPPQFAP